MSGFRVQVSGVRVQGSGVRVQVSGVRFQMPGVRCQGSRGNEVTNSNFMDVKDLEVYKKLCRLHIDVCELKDKWHK